MALTDVLRQHRLVLYGFCSTVLVSAVIVNALQNYSNFFSVAFYLSRSGGSVMAVANFAVVIALIVGKVMQQVFFGPLRTLEVERLYDRTWYFLTESLLAFTIFRDEFDGVFALMFGILLFLKCFHWLLSDRVEWIDQMPYPGPSVFFHIRTTTLILILGFIDMFMLFWTVDNILTYGVGGIVLFASEYSILMASITNSLLKYLITLQDLRRARVRGGDTAPPWEDKSMYVFYVELVTDFLKLITYLAFFAVVMTFYGLPLNIIRDVYITARSFFRRVGDLMRYRNATRNMDERYPNATAQELEAMGDRTCIICREEMVSREPPAPGAAPAAPRVDGPNDTPKKLPCGHVFHFNCLRSWLERQQSCPTCRRPVLETAAPPAANGNANPAAAPPQPGQAPRPGVPVARANPPWAGVLGRVMGVQAQVPPMGPGAVHGPVGAPVAAGAQPGLANGPVIPNGAAGILRQPQPAPVFGGFQANGVWYPWGAQQPPANGPIQHPNLIQPAPDAPPTTTTITPTPTPTTGAAPIASSSRTEPAAQPPAPQPPAPSDDDAKELTPREAAARAALRRLGSKEGPALFNTTTTPVPPPSESPSASLPPSQDPSPPATVPVLSPTSVTTSASATSTTTVPPLIPLYDPSTGYQPTLSPPASVLASPPPYPSFSPRDMRQSARFAHLRPTAASFNAPRYPMPGPSMSSAPPIPLPPNVTDEQLQKLDTLTREALDERIRILENVQITAWKCMEDLIKVRSVLPSVTDAVRPSVRPASSPSPAPAGSSATTPLPNGTTDVHDKGKGKEKEVQPPDVPNSDIEGAALSLELDPPSI